MKIRERFTAFIQKAKSSLGRFPVSFANTFLFFLFTLVSIWSQEMNDDVAKLLLVFACSAVIATAVSLGFECFYDKFGNTKYLSAAGSILAELVLFVLSQFLEERVLLRVAAGLIMSGFVMSFYFISKKGKAMSFMAKALKNAAFSCFVGFVVFVGGFICILAFDTLVYSDYNFTDKLMFTHFLLCAVLVPSLLLILLPAKDEPEDNPGKGYKAVTVYAGLSLYFILSAILYLYIIRILISGELPSGGVNPFVTMASAAYIFLVFAISGYEGENSYVKFFSKFGGYLMIPLVIVQCVTLGIRIAHYGLTAPRVISICFIAITIMFIAGSVFRNKFGFGIPCIAASVIVLIITATPFNYESLALYNQEHILTSTLEKSGMLKDGVIDLEAEVSKDEHNRISSAYCYIVENGELPGYLTSDSTLLYDFGEKFGYGYDRRNDIISYCYYDNTEFASEMTDISEYSGIDTVYEYQFEPSLPGEGLILEYTDSEGVVHKYDLEPFVRYLFDKNKTGSSYDDAEGVYSLDENTDMYYRYISFDYNNFSGEITNLDISAYLLFK